MYELALFAGSAGGVLGTKYFLGWKTVCYVEKEAYPVEVIKARIRDGLLDEAPIWSDVRSFTKRNNQCRRFIRQLRKMRSELVVSAGFPCQPFSTAGDRLGEFDPQNMWPDTIRIIREVQPAWVFLENVPGLLAGSHGYYGTILRELAESGYDARWRVLSAAELGAPHKRDRLWIVAYPNGIGRGKRGIQPERFTERQNSAVFGNDGASRPMAYTDSSERRPPTQPRQLDSIGQYPEKEGREQSSNGFADGRQTLAHTYINDGNGRGIADQMGRQWSKGEITPNGHTGRIEWSAEPDIRRVANGVASRVDRLRAIGNGQVPIVAATAWRILTEGLTASR